MFELGFILSILFLVVPLVLFVWLIVALIRFLNRH